MLDQEKALRARGMFNCTRFSARISRRACLGNQEKGKEAPWTVYAQCLKCRDGRRSRKLYKGPPVVLDWNPLWGFPNRKDGLTFLEVG